MPSSSPPHSDAPQPSISTTVEAPIALRPRAPSQPTYADILSSMAPAADTIPFNDSTTDAPSPPPPSVSPTPVDSLPSTSPLAPSAVAGSPASSSCLPLPRSVTEPSIPQLGSLHVRDSGPRSATLGVDVGGAALDGKQQRRSFDEAQSKKPSSTSAAPAPAIATGKLVLEKLTLYETKTKLYVIASNQADSRYRVLKIDRTAPPQPALGGDSDQEEGEASGLVITEDATIYSKEEIQQLLETLTAGNVGGVVRVEPLFYGIAGFVRFTSTYYMIIIKSRAPVALIGGHYIYHCEETVLKPITPPTGTKNAEEARQMAAFQGVDLSKNFYFSYTYDLTHTLQHNLTRGAPDPSNSTNAFSSFNDKWVWNRHLLRPAFRGLNGKSPWVLPLIHGFVDQAKLSVFGRIVYITLIARRSRHFAGARFLKRGVNDQGYVANDVETEQIVSEALTTPFHAPAVDAHRHQQSGAEHKRRPNPRFTSFVQVRGSIPLYWSQESVNMSPKPPIELTVVDPFFSAAALHFDDLLGRYGGPITVLNLIKHKERAPRESKLLPEFKQCIDYLNQFLPDGQEIIYIPWDIAAANKQRDKDVIGILEDIAEESLEKTSFFHSGAEPTWYALNGDADSPPYRSTPLLQSGVVRTNCIDCLDRTNAAQFVIAKAALGHQLHALGVIHDPRLPFDSDGVNLITEMYHDHGDTIALQYGGSHLVNTMETYRKIGQWTSHSRDMIENLRRYYANSFVDADKQAAIDLFLGIEPSPPPLPTHLPPPPPRPRRSYRDWYTSSHLEATLSPAEAELRLQQTIETDVGGSANYWQSYYRPKLFTELARHFAYKVNSTLKYKPAAHGADPIDQSPFTPRLTAPHPPARLNVGGVRRWMSHRGNAKTTLRTRIQSQRIDEAQPAPTAPPSTTEGIVARLLNPSVEPDEAREYASYVDQFENLSLSQDLSEKDALLYRNSAGLAAEGGASLTVDRASLALYREAASLARATEEDEDAFV